MPDEVNPTGRQNMVMGHAQSRQGCSTGNLPHALRVLAREHGHYAGGHFRLLDVDRANQCRRVRTAHDDRVVHARHLDIFDVSGRARDQSWIFTAADTLPD